MFKLGKLTDYGTVVMTVLAAAPGHLRNVQDLATQTRIAAPTVAKLLKQLARGGLLDSVRGAHGGYRLSRPPAAISVADVVTALEGPIALTQCSTHGGGCAIEMHCGVRGNWRLIGSAVRHALEAVTLEQMAAPLRVTDPGAESPLQFIPPMRPAQPAVVASLDENNGNRS